VPKFRQEEMNSIQQAFHAGRELVEAGMLEDAIACFDKVIQRLPRRRRDRIYRIETKAKAKAIPSGNVSWLPPVFRDALLAKAFCLNELGRAKDACTTLERAAELDPDNAQVFAELGFTHGSQDNVELARQAYAHALELEPNNPAYLRALAQLALMSDEFAEARTLSLRALEFEPDNNASLHHLAYAEYRLGDIARAVTILEQILVQAPDDPDNVCRLAGMLREAGRIREAIKRVDAYLAKDPRNPEVLGLMSDLLQQDGTAPELLPHARRLLARNPNDPTALDLLSWGHYQQGQLNEALEIMRRLVQLEPMQAYHHFKLGILHQAVGHLQPAMASFLRAVTLDTNGEVEAMAMEAISTLDQVQIEQLLNRAKIDPGFRYHLQHNSEMTLHQAGYLLSPLGFMMLQTVDLSEDIEGLSEANQRTIH